jgi:hypothetical protein
MNRSEIKNFIYNNFEKKNFQSLFITIRNKYPEVNDDIINETKYLKKYNFNERLYHILNEIYDNVLCKNQNCNNIVRFNGFNVGYNKYCCRECAYKDPEWQESREETNLKKYGVRIPLQNNDIISKQINTTKERYGVTNVSQIQSVKNKKIKKSQLKYGTDYTFQAEEIKNKCVCKHLINLGVRNVAFNNDIKLKRMRKQRNNFLEKMEVYLQDWKIKLLDEEYVHYHFHHNWKCLKCNTIFNQWWNVIQISNGKVCPVCYPKTSKSIQQDEVFEFIRTIYDGDVIKNTKKIIYPKELDIYLPDKKLAIEFNGLYWHSEENVGSDYHVIKTNECEKKGIKLIHIFEDEWVSKKEIVKEKIKNILIKNININEISKIKISIISETEKNEFLTNFSLKDFDKSDINLGIIYKNKIASVMTFFKKSDQYVISRFCDNFNFLIENSFGKLLEYFKKNFEWKSIIGYSDRRWDDDHLFENEFFKKIKVIKPVRWYCVNYKRFLNKESFKNKKYITIFDSGYTEFSIENEASI